VSSRMFPDSQQCLSDSGSGLPHALVCVWRRSSAYELSHVPRLSRLSSGRLTLAQACRMFWCVFGVGVRFRL
jgi:hypothetical protein